MRKRYRVHIAWVAQLSIPYTVAKINILIFDCGSDYVKAA